MKKATQPTALLITITLTFHAASVQAAEESSPGQSDSAPVATAQERIGHFAVVCCGWSRGSKQHKKWYWQSNERIGKMLKEVYGYPDESVYRLCEEGKTRELLDRQMVPTDEYNAQVNALWDSLISKAQEKRQKQS